jgi:glutamyl-Q tRNA(Asp) synthetase
LVNRKLAKANSGCLLLRIEDIDPYRSRRQFETALMEDLAWLEFHWVEMPRRQSEHLDRYRAELDSLVARDLAYFCFCSRADIARDCAKKVDWPYDPDGASLYPGTCRNLTEAERRRRGIAGMRHCVRLNMAKALAVASGPLTYREFYEGETSAIVCAKPEAWGDALIGRRDVPASYHIACTVDDHDQGVTDVVRGLDLEAATGLHRLLQELLGLRTPNYWHHRLVLDAEGRKLSKSKASPAIRDLRARGASAASIRTELSQRMKVIL